MRIIIGDVHGCLHELERLVRNIGYRRERDSLVMVGDLIDRGPDPIGVVAYAMELGATLVRGNHEDAALRWLDFEERVRNTPGFVNPMEPPPPPPAVHKAAAPRELTPEQLELRRRRQEVRMARGETLVHPQRPAPRPTKIIPEFRKAQWRAFSAEQLQWLRGSAPYLDLTSKWYVVHAGLEPRPFGEQDPKIMMRVRFINPATGHMRGYDEGSVDQPKGTVTWQEVWQGPENLIYGHIVHSRRNPRIDTRETPNGIIRCYGIDTGCVYGGRLTAIVFEDEEMRAEPTFVQVDAERAYVALPGPIPDEVPVG
jgi:diadenosine tetraphosphatase ApaH/serine/threonine PP2A family protein phosphatase